MFRLVKFLCHERPGAFEVKVSRDRSYKALLGCPKYVQGSHGQGKVSEFYIKSGNF